MNHTPLNIPEEYMRAWADFQGRVEHQEMRRAEVYSFPQTWGDTTCGHGGIGGQAVTQAQTIIFRTDMGGWWVYQAGEFSYHVERGNEEFYEHVKNWNLIGETDYNGQYERE